MKSTLNQSSKIKHMRDLVALFAGLGIGFLAAREYDRLVSEKARLEAFEQEAAGSVPGPGMIGSPPPVPQEDEPTDQFELQCDLCQNEWQTELPMTAMTAECPNCGTSIEVR